MGTFEVLVDTVQMRLAADGLSTLVGAQDWDVPRSTNFWLDGVTGTGFLIPACYENVNWLNSNSGIYAKIPPSDYTLTPSSGWLQVQNNPDGSSWLKFPNNTGGAKAITTYSVAVNQAVVVEMFINPGTAAGTVIGQFGWGASGDYTTGVSMNLYSNGSADIYQAGAFLYTLTASGQNSDYGQTDGQIPSQAQGQYIAFVMIPFRERELLVLCSNGGGFAAIFANIPEGNPGNLPITPNAPIWFEAPAGVDTIWRLALCQYESTGNAIGKRSFWRYDPGASPTGGFQGWIDGDTSGGTLAGPFGGGSPCGDGLTPSSPYANNTNGVALNIAMTGSTQMSGPYTVTTTPFIYAARGYTKSVLANTWGENPLDITNYVLEFSYDYPDTVAGRKAHMVLKDPKAIIAAGVALDPVNQPGALIQAISGRSWRVTDQSGTQIMEGINLAPKMGTGIYINSMGQAVYGTDTNPAEWVSIEMRDPYLLAEDFIFKDQYPLDGYTLLQALTLITDNAGITDSTNSLGMGARTWNMSASLASFVLPNSGNVTDSDFNCLIESGDKASQKIQDIVERFAANAFFDMVPMGGWSQPTLLDTADMPASPTVSLYDSAAEAIAQGISSPTYLNLFRKCEIQMLDPEANDVYVQGYDYRTKRPLLCHQFDAVNSDPTVIPANRLPPWLGRRRSYSWNDPDISTIGAAQYAEGLIYPRITIARSLVEIDADFLASLPRGALLKLYFKTGGGVISPSTGLLVNPATVRIKTISSRFIYTANDGRAGQWLPTTYVCQLDIGASMLMVGRTNVHSILLEWGIKAISKITQRTDANDKPIWRRPLILQDEV